MRNKQIIRQTLDEVRAVNAQIDDINVDTALDYLERYQDHKTVVDKMKERYAFSIRKADSSNTAAGSTDELSGYYTYENALLKKVVEKSYEHVTSGIYSKIVHSLADLFTNKTSYFDFVDPNSNKSVDEAEKRITEQREAGGFDTELAGADAVAAGVHSGPLYIDYAGGHLGYRAFSPAAIHAKFGNKVIENGTERAAIPTLIEDAICIVLTLDDGTSTDTSTQSDEKEYLAIFGKSEEWPLGRHVTFRAGSWDSFPKVGDDNSLDWTTAGGEIANPLTWANNQYDNIYGVEYPVVIFKGGFNITSNKLIPVSSSLFENCLEIDLALSRVLHTSLRSARGSNVLKNPENNPLPHTTEGNIVLLDGQEMSIMGQPVSNSVGALDVIVSLTRIVAEGSNVPGYHVIHEGGGQAESGISLYIRTLPAISFREHRANVNKTEVARLFQIERGLYKVFSEKNQDLAGPEVVQVWNPGRFIMPEAELDKVTRVKASLDAGFIDYPTAIMEMHDLPNIKSAEAYIDEMEERKTEYPAPTQGQQGGMQGLLGKLPTRQPKGANKAKAAPPGQGEEKEEK
jgi:hypothetical protein